MTDGPSDRRSATSPRRWVYVSGIIAIVLILLFVILHLTGGGMAPERMMQLDR